MSTETQLKRVFEEKSDEMKTALLLSALQAIRTPGSRFTVFIFSVYPTKEFCHCSWHQGAPQIYPGNSQIRKTRKSTDFRPLLWFAQEWAEETVQLRSQEVARVFLYGSTTSNQAHMLRKVWIIPFAHVCTSLSRSRTRWFDVKEILQCTLVRSEEVMWVIYSCWSSMAALHCNQRTIAIRENWAWIVPVLSFIATWDTVRGALSTSKEATSTQGKWHSDSRVQMPL